MSAVVGCAQANSSLHRPDDLLYTWKRHKLYEIHKSLLRPGLMRKSAYFRCNISTQELCTNGSEVVFALSSMTVLFFSLNFKSDCKRKEIVGVKMSTKTALSPSSFAFTSCFASAHWKESHFFKSYWSTLQGLVMYAHGINSMFAGQSWYW